GAEVLLDGSASTDPDGSIASFAWAQTSGDNVTLQNADTHTARFTAPVTTTDKTLKFKLTVTDNKGATGSEDVTVTVHGVQPDNANPVARAGENREVFAGDAVQLDGRGSSDADGQIVAWQWSQANSAEPAADLGAADTALATFTAPVVHQRTEYLFRLLVTDDRGATASDTVTVAVLPVVPANQRPVANAGADFEVQEAAEDLM